MRQDPVITGLVTRLHVTPSGMTVTTPTAITTASGSLDVSGKPVLNAAAQMDVGFAAHGATLFASVRCDDDHACAFTTKNGCEGTITGDNKGNVVLVTTGECRGWSGKWLAEKDDAPRESAPPSACPPVPACPPAVTCAPCPPGTPPPPPPSVPPPSSAAPDNTTCMTACNDAQLACTRGCKISDMPCFRQCSNRTMECLERCH